MSSQSVDIDRYQIYVKSGVFEMREWGILAARMELEMYYLYDISWLFWMEYLNILRRRDLQKHNPQHPTNHELNHGIRTLP